MAVIWTIKILKQWLEEIEAGANKLITNKNITIVSPIPRLKIPAKGARGRSLNPEDIHFGSAHPSKREKWLP